MIEFEFELDYFDQVEDDIELAKFLYYEQSPDTDLEERFADAIKESIHKLQKNPFIYYPVFENIRVAHPKFFPYGIHFVINEDKKEILIIAILHNKEDKSKITKRL
jgi:plasmid stabilization system protein ParE